MNRSIQLEPGRGDLSSTAMQMLKTTAVAWALPVTLEARQAAQLFQSLPPGRSARAARAQTAWAAISGQT